MNKQALTLFGAIYVALLVLGGGAYFIYILTSQDHHSLSNSELSPLPQNTSDPLFDPHRTQNPSSVSEKTFSLSGTVFRDQKTIAQAEVFLYLLAPQKKEPFFIRTNEQGQFNFLGLKKGTYQLKATYGHQWTCLSETFQLKENLQIPLTLVSGSQLFGQVVDENRRPLEQVKISILASSDAQMIPEAMIESDVEGKFAFPVLPDGNYVLYFQKKGFCSQIVSDLSIRPNRLIQLFPGGVLRGKVLHKDTKIPISRVRIEALNQNWFERLFVEESGYFQLEGVPFGTFQLKIDAPGFLPVLLSIPIAKGETLSKEILLEPGFSLKGRVFDMNQRPVEGAKVMVLRESAADVLTQVTEENGTFELNGLNGGTLVFVQVFKDGYTQLVEEQNKPFFVKTERNAPTEINVSLKKAPILKGIIKKASGEGIAGAKVTLIQNTTLPLPIEYQRPFRTTDATGKFEFSSIFAGSGYQIQIEHPSYAFYTSEAFLVTGNETTIEKNCSLEAGHFLNALVKGPLQEALVDYQVTIFSVSEAEGWVIEPVSVKREGAKFTAGPLSSTPKMIQIKAKGYALTQVEIPNILNQSDLEIQLQEGVSLSGKIEDAQGNPLSNVTVYTLYNSQRLLSLSNAEGQFEIKDLQAGPYTIFAFKENFGAFELSVEAPQAEISVKLIEVMTIRGQVTSKNKSVQRFSIHYRSDNSPEQSRDILSPDGTFFLENIPNVPISMEIRAFGYAPYELGPLTPSQMGDLNIQMAPGLKVEGVVESNGTPVSGVTIVRGEKIEDFDESTEEGRAAVLGFTDENGFFSLDAFGSKTETITFLHSNYAPYLLRVSPPANNLKIELPEGCSLQISVKNTNYQPLPNIGIVLTGPVLRRTESGDDGTVNIQNLIPGTYRIEVWDRSENYQVHLQSGQPNTFEIVLVE